MEKTQYEVVDGNVLPKYEIKNNKEFLNWLNDKIKSGYNCIIDVDEIKNLIDTITDFCIKNIYKKDVFVLDINKLYSMLSTSQINLLQCNYRYNNVDMYKTDNIEKLRFSINRKQINQVNFFFWKYKIKKLIIDVESITGQVIINDTLNKILGNKNINIEDLIIILESKYPNELNLLELEKCVYNHDTDIELRDKILELVIQKILCVKTKTLEVKDEKLNEFIADFNGEENICFSKIYLKK